MMFIVLVILAVFASALGQMALKHGAMAPARGLLRQYLNPWVICGYAILAVALLTNVFCLSRGVLVNQIAALESLGYLFVPLLARFFFRESFTPRKIAATAVIMAGVLVFFS